MRIVDADLWQVHNLAVGRVHWRANLGTQPNDAAGSLKDWALAQSGHWVAVVENDEGVFGITDNLRSFPILYTYDGDLLVSSTPAPLLAAMDSPRLDRTTTAEFLHGAYLLGPQTLIAGVSSVRAGSVTDLQTGRIVQTYRQPTSYQEADAEPAEYLQYFYEVLLAEFEKVAATGRQLLVPLSGGADSRLIMLALNEIGAKNVLTFTYGTPGSAEVRISEQVANNAGYRWQGIELDRQVVHDRWIRPETADFLRATWSGEALPHIQDWYALQEIDADPDGIVLPGHTIVGAEHDDEALDSGPVSKRQAMDLITAHHFDLRGEHRAAGLPASLQGKLWDFVEQKWEPGNRAGNAQALVEFNVITRQPRYINNSMRGYEYFGFDWALPMLTAKPWEVWLAGPQAIHTGDRRHYLDFVNQKYAKAYGSDLGYFATRAGNIEQGRKEKIKSALRTLHLLGPLTNLARIRTERRHPMAFDALSGPLSPRQYEAKLWHGYKTLGIYAELFINNQWVPGQHVVPER